MKTISRMMMIAVLLVVALTLSAQGVTNGTYDPLGGTGSLSYSFSGGKVIKKHDYKWQLNYSYEVEEGATLSFSCSSKYYGGRIIIWDENGKAIKETKGKSPSMTYQVPKGKDVIHVALDMGMPHSTEVDISCIVKKPSKSSGLSNYKGTISYLETKMEYSFSGAIVTQKKVASEGYDTNVMQLEIKGQTEAGATVSATYKKIAGCVKEASGPNVSITAYTSQGKTINLQNKSGNGSSTVSGKVPDNASKISILMTYQDITLRQINCYVTLDVVKKADAQENKSLKWNDESTANRCEHCHGQISKYTVNSSSFDAYVCCNNHRNEQKKYARKVNNWYDYIYYNDLVWTDYSGSVQIFNKCEDVRITISENSLIYLKKRTSDGRDIWVLEKGSIVGEGLKRTDCEFEMTYCTAKPTGTTYVLENDGKSSRVYLLDGSMEVTSKKGSKKSTLKPGQTATVNNQGQMSVNTFDVGAMAKKYKISGISTTTTTTTTTTSAPKGKYARYGVKSGIVKRVVTTAKDRTYTTTWFDDYGRLERSENTKKETKSGNKWVSAANYKFVTIIKDDKQYRLDPGHKRASTYSLSTVTNFLNPEKIVQGYGVQKSGTAKVGDKTCDVFKGKEMKLAGDATIEHYVWQGIPLKSVETAPDGTTTTTLESLELPSSMDASLFEIPKGYSVK